MKNDYPHKFPELFFDTHLAGTNLFSVEKSLLCDEKFRHFYNKFLIPFSRKAELLPLMLLALVGTAALIDRLIGVGV